MINSKDKELNSEKIPTQRCKRWSTTQIFNILTNAIYSGKQITHKQVNSDINLDGFVHDGQVYKSRKPVAVINKMNSYIKDLNTDISNIQTNLNKAIDDAYSFYINTCTW